VQATAVWAVLFFLSQVPECRTTIVRMELSNVKSMEQLADYVRNFVNPQGIAAGLWDFDGVVNLRVSSGTGSLTESVWQLSCA